MESYCIVELVCRVVYNGELLHMLNWSVWWSIMGCEFMYVELFCLVVYNRELLHMLSWSVWWSVMVSYCIC